MSIRSSSSHSHDPSIAAPDDDPVSALVHAAVADRPLEEVADLITLLEESPQYARATVDALRAVGTDRSVEDITRLVTLLTRPPRDAASADEAIRAAAENRPVEEVTRLMALLHRTQTERHFGQEAARAAAQARPVEDLVELIGRLSEEREALAALPETEPPGQPHGETEWGPGGVFPPPVPLAPPLFGADRPPPRLARTPDHPAERLSWPGLLVAAALFLCAMLWFPLYEDGEPFGLYASSVAVSALCAMLAVLVTLRPVPPALALAVVVPAVLAAAQLYQGRFHSAWLSRALDLTLAPSWVAGLAAVIAALAALMALVVRIASNQLPVHADARHLATANRSD
ncbi:MULTISPECIES: hypothetical protein [unclassified Streptomyces]|uniref:hypothetical protein n=1 Tax=unclassified Streptomyces TaxID=2593676 RepID=UPI0022575368|nr:MULTISPECIES: hypothetical protein [unclassified Streptomyces]MCX5053873.1 hypothetical protein [Streptomyces sp. NBC_00474]